MKDNVSATYARQAKGFKLLDANEEQALAAKIADGDTDALKRLVEANLCLVIKIAHEYKGMGVDFDDLVGAGNIGLIHAAQHFRSGVSRFDSYAHHRIRYEMRKIVSRMAGVSCTKYRTDRLIHNLKEKYGDETEKISEQSGFTQKHVLNVLKAGMKKKVYLQDNVDDDERKTYLDILSDEPCESQFSMLEVRECVALMMKCFEMLCDKDKYVLESVYGINRKQKSLADLGKELGCTRENVRVIKEKAQQRLKDAMFERM